MIMADQEQEIKRITCPSCGCGDLRVNPGGYVRHTKGETIRVKVCRHCNRKVVTRETRLD